MPHVWWNVGRALCEAVLLWAARWRSVLGLLERQSVHVQRFSHGVDLGVGVLKSRGVVERVNKVGEGE